ncbi:MAG: hypothetical protein ACQXXL_04890 [Candidatus Methanosuratincola sp.]|nr:hypothetical protein [Candidatus Methanosuratincola sp.]
MFITFSSCEVCGRTIEGRDCLPVVEAECTGCATRARVCPGCKRRGCPICGGSLKSTWTLLSEKKAPVGQIARGTKGRRRL